MKFILKLENRLRAEEQVLCIDYNGGGGNKDTEHGKDLEDLNIMVQLKAR